jgi:hypothetical protein
MFKLFLRIQRVQTQLTVGDVIHGKVTERERERARLGEQKFKEYRTVEQLLFHSCTSVLCGKLNCWRSRVPKVDQGERFKFDSFSFQLQKVDKGLLPSKSALLKQCKRVLNTVQRALTNTCAFSPFSMNQSVSNAL